MAGPKEKIVEKKELPKIKMPVAKPPQAVKLRALRPMRVVRREAREAMSRTERNATRVAVSFVDQFTTALNKTPEGKKFLANMKKNSEIGGLLFV